MAPANGASGAGATIVFIGALASGGCAGDDGLAVSGKAKGLAIVSGGSAGKSVNVGGAIGSVAAVVCGMLGSTFSI
jgi:hypothetical protein